MPGHPPVPSKDALRALRYLAHSPPAAFIGTTGVLCGVAALHYHEHGKRQRVEQILETKRKLHSISNGRGSARLALMFEAAERGDDFTLRRRRSPKPSNGRKQSDLAVQNEDRERADWQPPAHESDESTRKSKSRTVPKSRATDPNADTGKLVNSETDSLARSHVQSATRKPVDTQHAYSAKQSPIQSYLVADDHTASADISQGVNWDQMQRLSMNRRKWHTQTIRNMLSQSSNPLSSDSADSVEQSFTDLNPLHQQGDPSLSQTSDSQAMKTVDGSLPESIVLEIDPLAQFNNNSFSSLRPWPTFLSTKETEIQTEAMQENQEVHSIENFNGINLYIASDAECPASEEEDTSMSRYDFTHSKILKGMSVIGIDRYKHVFAAIMRVKREQGKVEALLLLEQTMERYAATGKGSDFAFVQALFLDCVFQFSFKNLEPIIWRFITKLLSGDVPRTEAVTFLYPDFGRGSRPDEQYYYFRAHRYLEHIIDEGFTFNEQTVMLRKIVHGTLMCKISLHEHLMIPVLRSMCLVGQMSIAQALLEEMTSVYKIKTTFYTQQVLIKGYAQIGNWSKVKAILDDCYNDDSTTKKTYGISNLMVSVIRDYANFELPQEVVSFVKHCTQRYGIQPVSNVTKEIACLCIRHHRYDLLLNWLNMVRTKFSDIDTGTSSSTFAFEVGCAWKETKASCEDILNACRVIAHQAVRDPFSKAFRATISESITRYLDFRFNELRNALGSIVPEISVIQTDELRTALQDLKSNMPIQKNNLRTRLLVTALIHQCDAVREIDALCGGDFQSRNSLPRLAPSREKRQKVTKKPTLRLPPSFRPIQESLLKIYLERSAAGKPVEHTSLRETVAQLVEQGREAHACRLIESIYHSPWAQPSTGLEFDHDLFLDWMKAAWQVRSGEMLRSSLWAIIDASPQLRISSQIILLARIAAPKAHQQRYKYAKKENVDEIEYLRHRLKKRVWLTTTGTRLQLREWAGFGAVNEAAQ